MSRSDRIIYSLLVAFGWPKGPTISVSREQRSKRKQAFFLSWLLFALNTWILFYTVTKFSNTVPAILIGLACFLLWICPIILFWPQVAVRITGLDLEELVRKYR